MNVHVSVCAGLSLDLSVRLSTSLSRSSLLLAWACQASCCHGAIPSQCSRTSRKVSKQRSSRKTKPLLVSSLKRSFLFHFYPFFPFFFFSSFASAVSFQSADVSFLMAQSSLLLLRKLFSYPRAWLQSAALSRGETRKKMPEQGWRPTHFPDPRVSLGSYLTGGRASCLLLPLPVGGVSFLLFLAHHSSLRNVFSSYISF